MLVDDTRSRHDEDECGSERLEPAVELTGVGLAEPERGELAEAEPRQLQPSDVEFGLALAEATMTSPTSAGVSCPICLDVLLRPVVLACGHRTCRLCLVKYLQTRSTRATASETGKASCPLARCEIPPMVPPVDRSLQASLEVRFAAALAARSVRLSEADEAREAESLNAWAAAGCPAPRDEQLERARAAGPPTRARRAKDFLGHGVMFVFMFMCFGMLALTYDTCAESRTYEWRCPSDTSDNQTADSLESLEVASGAAAGVLRSAALDGLRADG